MYTHIATKRYQHPKSDDNPKTDHRTYTLKHLPIHTYAAFAPESNTVTFIHTDIQYTQHTIIQSGPKTHRCSSPPLTHSKHTHDHACSHMKSHIFRNNPKALCLFMLYGVSECESSKTHNANNEAAAPPNTKHIINPPHQPLFYYTLVYYLLQPCAREYALRTDKLWQWAKYVCPYARPDVVESLAALRTKPIHRFAFARPRLTRRAHFPIPQMPVNLSCPQDNAINVTLSHMKALALAAPGSRSLALKH